MKFIIDYFFNTLKCSKMAYGIIQTGFVNIGIIS